MFDPRPHFRRPAARAARASRLGAAFRALGLALALPLTLTSPPAQAQTAAALAGASSTGVLGCDPGERVLRFAHVVVEKGHPKGEAAAEFAAEINRRFNGRMCMKVFPNSTLFDDNDVFDGLLRGEVEFAAPSLSKFETYTRAFRIFDLPFLFRDERSVEWFQNTGPGQRLRRRLKGTGLKGMAFWNAGMKQFSATRPLVWPKDAAGLTFRVQQSDVLAALIQQLGAKAKPMPFKAVREALSKGEVQGQENSWANIYSKEFYKFQDGVTESNHGLLSYLVVTSDRFWESVPDQDRPELNQALLAVTARANERSREIAKINRAALVNAGVEIRTLSAEQRQDWVAKMRPVWRKFAGDVGDDLIFSAESANQ